MASHTIAILSDLVYHHPADIRTYIYRCSVLLRPLQTLAFLSNHWAKCRKLKFFGLQTLPRKAYFLRKKPEAPLDGRLPVPTECAFIASSASYRVAAVNYETHCANNAVCIGLGSVYLDEWIKKTRKRNDVYLYLPTKRSIRIKVKTVWNEMLKCMFEIYNKFFYNDKIAMM